MTRTPARATPTQLRAAADLLASHALSLKESDDPAEAYEAGLFAQAALCAHGAIRATYGEA